MSEGWNIEDISLGLEMGLMSQEQVVSEFRELAERDIMLATEQYDTFVDRLTDTASGDDGFIRMLQGGPDSSCRAGLLDILSTSYSSCSVEVREKIRDKALEPFLGDNSFYVKLAVARITNPYLVGDIIREERLFFPGPAYYKEDLLKSVDVDDPEALQQWLDKLGHSLFAATSMALLRDNPAAVRQVIVNNLELFEGAAHVIAANNDIKAEIRLLQGSTEAKDDMLDRFALPYTDEFTELINAKAEESNWLPVGEGILILYKDVSS